MSFEIYEANDCGHNLNWVHLAFIACFISYEKWVWRERRYPSNACLPYVALVWALITLQSILTF